MIKKISICVLILIISFALFACDDEQLSTYSSEYYEITYDENIWEKGHMSPPSQDVVDIVAFSIINTDGFNENVNIIVEETSLSIDEYMNNTLDVLEQQINDFNLIVEDEGSWSFAKKIIYTGTVDGNNLKWKQLIDIEEGADTNLAYIITYTAEENAYDTYLDDVYDLLDLFNLK